MSTCFSLLCHRTVHNSWVHRSCCWKTIDLLLLYYNSKDCSCCLWNELSCSLKQTAPAYDFQCHLLSYKWNKRSSTSGLSTWDSVIVSMATSQTQIEFPSCMVLQAQPTLSRNTDRAFCMTTKSKFLMAGVSPKVKTNTLTTSCYWSEQNKLIPVPIADAACNILFQKKLYGNNKLYWHIKNSGK